MQYCIKLHFNARGRKPGNILTNARETADVLTASLGLGPICYLVNQNELQVTLSKPLLPSKELSAMSKQCQTHPDSLLIEELWDRRSLGSNVGRNKE